MQSILLFLVVGASVSQSGDLAGAIELVAKQGRGTPEGRAAWDRVAASGPDALPAILEAIKGRDTVADNWLRTAFDQITRRALKEGGGSIDLDRFLNFAKNATKPGRSRRLALDLVEELRPGTSEKLYPGWLEDAEFRYEAAALTIAQARALAKRGDAKAAEELFRLAFASARDMQQARDAAVGFPTGQAPSVGQHLGFLMDWQIIGPFDGHGQKGFHLEYPPEKRIDLGQELEGQERKLRWKRYQVKEPPLTSTGRHQALVDLRAKEALGDADDAVAFAYTEFAVSKAQTVEFRGAADDNFTVWVNRQKIFAFEEWRNGVRHDRHRFTVMLREGKNTVLVKVCQSAAPNPEPNWEFFLRVVDATGKGIPMKNLLE